MMRWGDYIVLTSLALNLACVAAYLAQGHWRNALYFVGAACWIGGGFCGESGSGPWGVVMVTTRASNGEGRGPREPVSSPASPHTTQEPYDERESNP